MTTEQQTLAMAGVQAIKDAYGERIDRLENDAKLNQPIIDNIVVGENKRATGVQFKTVDQQIADAMSSRKQEFESFLNGETKNFRINLERKTSGQLDSSHVTGNLMTNYASQGAILPGHQINFRDLIGTQGVNNGSWTFYREGTVTNSFAQTSEFVSKPAQDYTWSEQRVSCVYTAAQTRFSKNLSYNLNFLQNTITRQLLRDFYRRENQLFNDTVAVAGTGNSSVTNPSATVDIEEIIGVVANQIASGYQASYIIIDPQQWRRLATTKPNDYSLPSVVSTGADGLLRINGVPLITAPWAQTDHVLVIDSSQIVRVEGESLRVEFFVQDQDNVIKNAITARCECFENIAILRPDSIIYKDMGNS